MKKCAMVLAGVILLTVSLVAADPLDTWSEYPAPAEVGRLSTIAYGNGTFVALGSDGAVINSTNGMDWAKQDSGTTNHLDGVKFVNGNFFIFQREPGASTLVSSNGVEWAELPRVSEPFSVDMMELTYGEGIYAGLFWPSFYAISTNLVDWDFGDPEFGNGYLTYGGGRFVGNVITISSEPSNSLTVHSDDGVEWSAGEFSVSYLISEVVYANGQFLLPRIDEVNNEEEFYEWYELWYSSDGIAWTNSLTLLNDNRYGHNMAAGGDYYVFAMGDLIYYTTHLTPADVKGTNDHWTEVSLEIPESQGRASQVVFGNDSFVALVGGRIFKSNPIIGAAPVQIVQQPQAAGVSAGGTASFEVVAEGAEPITYQWRKDGEIIEGATNSTLVITNVTMASAGTYDVLVTNSEGTITSEAALLTVYSTDIKRFSGVILRGKAGDSVLIEYQNALDPTNQWTVATNVTLTAPEWIWFDLESSERPNRYYRTTYQEE